MKILIFAPNETDVASLNAYVWERLKYKENLSSPAGYSARFDIVMSPADIKATLAARHWMFPNWCIVRQAPYMESIDVLNRESHLLLAQLADEIFIFSGPNTYTFTSRPFVEEMIAAKLNKFQE